MVSDYWGRPSRGIIECCVVKDLNTWPPELQAKMEPEGIAKIREGAGVCLGTTTTLGKRFSGKARVYAVAEHDYHYGKDRKDVQDKGTPCTRPSTATATRPSAAPAPAGTPKAWRRWDITGSRASKGSTPCRT